MHCLSKIQYGCRMFFVCACLCCSLQINKKVYAMIYLLSKGQYCFRFFCVATGYMAQTHITTQCVPRWWIWEPSWLGGSGYNTECLAHYSRYKRLLFVCFISTVQDLPVADPKIVDPNDPSLPRFYIVVCIIELVRAPSIAEIYYLQQSTNKSMFLVFIKFDDTTEAITCCKSI